MKADHQNDLTLVITAPNGSFSFKVPRKIFGREILEMVCSASETCEIWYFGLIVEASASNPNAFWLDLDKRLIEQIALSSKKGQKGALNEQINLRLRVKCIPSSVEHDVIQSTTRHQLYEHVRSEIASGRLESAGISFDSLFQLAALALQAEFGDSDNTEHELDHYQAGAVSEQERLAGSAEPLQVNRSEMGNEERNHEAQVLPIDLENVLPLIRLFELANASENEVTYEQFRNAFDERVRERWRKVSLEYMQIEECELEFLKLAESSFPFYGTLTFDNIEFVDESVPRNAKTRTRTNDSPVRKASNCRVVVSARGVTVLCDAAESEKVNPDGSDLFVRFAVSWNHLESVTMKSSSKIVVRAFPRRLEAAPRSTSRSAIAKSADNLREIVSRAASSKSSAAAYRFEMRDVTALFDALRSYQNLATMLSRIERAVTDDSARLSATLPGTGDDGPSQLNSVPSASDIATAHDASLRNAGSLDMSRWRAEEHVSPDYRLDLLIAACAGRLRAKRAETDRRRAVERSRLIALRDETAAITSESATLRNELRTAQLAESEAVESARLMSEKTRLLEEEVHLLNQKAAELESQLDEARNDVSYAEREYAERARRNEAELEAARAKLRRNEEDTAQLTERLLRDLQERIAQLDRVHRLVAQTCGAQFAASLFSAAMSDGATVAAYRNDVASLTSATGLFGSGSLRQQTAPLSRQSSLQPVLNQPAGSNQNISNVPV